MAVEFVTYAIDKLIDEDSNESLVIVYKNSNFEFVTIEYVNSQKYSIKENLLQMAKDMVR